MSAPVGYLPGDRWLVAGERAVVLTGGEASDAMRWWPSVRSGAGAAELIGEVFRDGVLGSGIPLAIVCTESVDPAASGDPVDKGTTVRVLAQGEVNLVVETLAGDQIPLTGAGLVTWSERVVQDAAVVYFECADALPGAADLLPMPAGVVRVGSARWQLCDAPVARPAAGARPGAPASEPAPEAQLAAEAGLTAEPEAVDAPQDAAEPEVVAEPEAARATGAVDSAIEATGDPEVDESVTVISTVPQTDPTAAAPDIEFATPGETGPDRTKSDSAESDSADSNSADSNSADSNSADSDRAESDSAESDGEVPEDTVHAVDLDYRPAEHPSDDEPADAAAAEQLSSEVPAAEQVRGTPPAFAVAALAALAKANPANRSDSPAPSATAADSSDATATPDSSDVGKAAQPQSKPADADATQSVPDIDDDDLLDDAAPQDREADGDRPVQDRPAADVAWPERPRGLSDDNPFPPITLPPFTPPPLAPPTFDDSAFNAPPLVTPPPFVPASTTLPPVALIERGPAGPRTAGPDSREQSSRAQARRDQPPQPRQDQQHQQHPQPQVPRHQHAVPPPPVAGDHDGYTQLAADLPGGGYPPSMPPAPAADQVYASICPAGHPNAPHAGSCRVCGAPIAHAEPVLTQRPMLGRIRLSTGPVFGLERRLVIGRAPSVSRVASSELPTLVTVPSPNQDISRSHVEVRTEDWHLVVTDLNSTNGTVVRAPGRPDQLLRPGQSVVAELGWTVDLGDGVSFVLEAAA